MKIEVVNYRDCWLDIKNSARFTMGKPSSNIYPTSEWKTEILRAEHSVIREGIIKIECYDVPSFVIGHIVRHHQGIEKYVQSFREDRSNHDEVPNRNTLQSVRLTMNFQAVINISRKRLCTCASVETRRFWTAVLQEIEKYEPELVNLCARECVYRGHCSEMKSMKKCTFDKSIFYEMYLHDYRNYNGEDKPCEPFVREEVPEDAD